MTKVKTGVCKPRNAMDFSQPSYTRKRQGEILPQDFQRKCGPANVFVSDLTSVKHCTVTLRLVID
jgi:hypothetical protein